MFDLVPGMELTPTNPMTLKPHALKSPAQVGKLTLISLQIFVEFFAISFGNKLACINRRAVEISSDQNNIK